MFLERDETDALANQLKAAVDSVVRKAIRSDLHPRMYVFDCGDKFIAMACSKDEAVDLICSRMTAYGPKFVDRIRERLMAATPDIKFPAVNVAWESKTDAPPICDDWKPPFALQHLEFNPDKSVRQRAGCHEAYSWFEALALSLQTGRKVKFHWCDRVVEIDPMKLIDSVHPHASRSIHAEAATQNASASPATSA